MFEHNIMKTEVECPTGNICQGLRRFYHVENNLWVVSNNSYLINSMQSE